MVDSFVLIPNILFNFLVNSAANYGPLSDTILSSSLCSLHTLSLKSLANSSAIVPSVVITKCVIFDSLSQTTKIAFFLTTISNLVLKSTNMCVKIIDDRLNFYFHFLFYFSFSFLFFSFSIFRTTRVRGYQSRCHISHNLMA